MRAQTVRPVENTVFRVMDPEKAKKSGIDHFILDNLQFLLSPTDDPFQSQNAVVRFLRNDSEFLIKYTVLG